MVRCFPLLVAGGTRVLDWAMRWYFDLRACGLEHLPSRGPAIIVGNHPTLIDGLLLYLVAPRRPRFIAHRVLYRHPLLGWLMRGMGFIPADGHGAVDDALLALERGDVVVVFPEGEIWDEGRMLELHGGVAVLALLSGAPLVPLGIAGAARAWPLGSWLPRPYPIALCLGPMTAWPRRGPEAVDEGGILAVLSDCRRRIQAAERTAARLLAKSSLGPARLLRAALAAVVLLPLVALLTATSPPFLPPPPVRSGDTAPTGPPPGRE